MNEDRPAQAASLMIASLCLLGLQDSFIKFLSAEISLWQFQMLRAGCNLVFVSLLFRFVFRDSSLIPERLWTVVLRSVLLVCAMMCFFGAIPFMSLSEAAAGLYVFPLFILVLSAIFFGEPLNAQRVIAILAGFAGTLLILKPISVNFNFVGLVPILAALFYASTVLTTRKLCRDEKPATLAMSGAIAFALTGSLGGVIIETFDPVDLAASWPYLFGGWKTMNASTIGIIVFCSVLNLLANIGLSKAYQSAESSWLAPFDYSYLIFATVWGFIMWNELPDIASLMGMVMIVGSGCYVVWQERSESRTKSVFSKCSIRRQVQ